LTITPPGTGSVPFRGEAQRVGYGLGVLSAWLGAAETGAKRHRCTAAGCAGSGPRTSSSDSGPPGGKPLEFDVVETITQARGARCATPPSFLGTSTLGIDPCRSALGWAGRLNAPTADDALWLELVKELCAKFWTVDHHIDRTAQQEGLPGRTGSAKQVTTADPRFRFGCVQGTPDRAGRKRYPRSRSSRCCTSPYLCRHCPVSRSSANRATPDSAASGSATAKAKSWPSLRRPDTSRAGATPRPGTGPAGHEAGRTPRPSPSAAPQRKSPQNHPKDLHSSRHTAELRRAGLAPAGSYSPGRDDPSCCCRHLRDTDAYTSVRAFAPPRPTACADAHRRKHRTCPLRCQRKSRTCAELASPGTVNLRSCLGPPLPNLRCFSGRSNARRHNLEGYADTPQHNLQGCAKVASPGTRSLSFACSALQRRLRSCAPITQGE
jgi:hypothetical protein